LPKHRPGRNREFSFIRLTHNSGLKGSALADSGKTEEGDLLRPDPTPHPALTVEELTARIRQEANEIPYERVYYTLKRMRTRHLKQETVEVVKLCMALQNNGLSITASFIAHLRNTLLGTALTCLHTLGDKHVLLLHRGGYGALRWSLSDVFTRYYEGTGGKA